MFKSSNIYRAENFITANPDKLFLIIKEDFKKKEIIVNLNEYLKNQSE